jgi:hypothetical protein
VQAGVINAVATVVSSETAAAMETAYYSYWAFCQCSGPDNCNVQANNSVTAMEAQKLDYSASMATASSTCCRGLVPAVLSVSRTTIRSPLATPIAPHL